MCLNLNSLDTQRNCFIAGLKMCKYLFCLTSARIYLNIINYNVLVKLL